MGDCEAMIGERDQVSKRGSNLGVDDTPFFDNVMSSNKHVQVHCQFASVCYLLVCSYRQVIHPFRAPEHSSIRVLAAGGLKIHIHRP